MDLGHVATAVRWLARIASIGSVLLLIAFAFGPSERAMPTAREWVALVFFPIGVALGALLAWRYEVAGALISLSSLGAFYIVAWLTRGAFPRGPYFLVFIVPALLFLLATMLAKIAAPASSRALL
jgi:hypothetical protein